MASSTTLTNPKPNAPNLLFKRHLDHLQLTLHPLLSVANGQPHPAFPISILHYHLLTEVQLDELAHFYHQRTPSALSLNYPAPVVMRWERRAGIEEKRRRFGRFIGLRGCETPAADGGKGAQEEDEEEMTQEEMDRWLEMKIRRGIERELERDMWRRKGF